MDGGDADGARLLAVNTGAGARHSEEGTDGGYIEPQPLVSGL